ncbi:Ldh family oxidoreductase [Amycolatopsis acidiphila]|uniref:Ldh family oxidoreductase n=1 Tax=Amycolatopsis acidiphila TaxID=715473 RepID=A0A557ZWR7_9PSEU|nr:Ldh family oxidoreductase [Amycolatopsis acidiphila]TVT16448.1 Ldh family oxidoreductase [Amycolatopsis acidiphila]UIJ57921.1 Ldh family oxidoreductase [Amycolatopsis acidiphila]GHG71100.1 sulfolactate dehydrogenase [Amycolatopsis acidiphila]
MFVALEEARVVAVRALRRLGLDATEADVTADHLLDCELRGLHYAGLARILSIADRLAKTTEPSRPIEVARETGVSALLNGGDRLGYLVGRRATELAIEKADANGIALVGAHNTYYTGMLSYYAEMATRRDLVVLIASNATPWVAPHGGNEARFGTNPVCFGFPSTGSPIIWDIGTSEIIHAQAVLAGRLGQSLPPGVAYDAAGAPTTDPAAALGGAFTPWGGHKGSGLAIVVQLLGVLAGSPILPGELTEFGFLIIALRPDLLRSTEDFKRDVSGYAEAIRATRPVAADTPVRMPFDRSVAQREESLARGGFEVPEPILAAVRAL